MNHNIHPSPTIQQVTNSIFMALPSTSQKPQDDNIKEDQQSSNFEESIESYRELIKKHASLISDDIVKHTILSYECLVAHTSQDTIDEFFGGCKKFFVEAFKYKKEGQPFGILLRSDYDLNMSPSVVALAVYLIEEKRLTVDQSIEFIHSRLRPEHLEESTHDWLSPIFVEQLRFYVMEKKADINYQYLCQICRHVLFKQEDLIEHEPTEKRGNKDFEYKKLRKDLKKGISKSSKSCTSLYARDKMEWMGTMVGDEGRLDCPQCGHRVGAYKWSGSQCSCGIWVCPSIQIQISRVDKR
ncbi:hypothetical protein C9374_004602 [Naegleria lovaniensis]|uniref:Uncharacterized protein n=1 Tax=Naegleria lovaniensis TaxID=51637 RepID=A0AA88GSF7_NAELO|nr:uncharacterized protein C9374_004602 [Naegleria lovaniensis]KAG2383265.1 hypothetical protein C9374_004602 [Naegleria lovaniensis]